jgi:hypothetical protein
LRTGFEGWTSSFGGSCRCRFGWWRGRNERQLFYQLKSGAANQLRHHCGIEARGVVFDQQGAGGAVKGDAANAVDFACIGEREDLRFAGLAAVAEEDFNRGHRSSMIAILRAGCLNSQGFKEVENFWVGPIGLANESAADTALAVDDKGLGPAGGAVLGRGDLLRVPNSGEIDMALDQESPVGALIFVDADGEDGVLGMLAMELLERRQLGDAGPAPAAPKIEQDDLAAIAGKMHGAGVVGNGKIGRCAADLRGVAAAVAAGGRDSQRQTDAGCDAPL